VLPAKQDAGSTPYMPTFKGQYDLQALVASLTFDGTFGK
jgi:hypothetical protein